MPNPHDVDRLIALLEEHGIVPEQGSPERGEEGSWGLTHRYILERVEQADNFPMSAEEVRAILKPDRGDDA